MGTKNLTLNDGSIELAISAEGTYLLEEVGDLDGMTGVDVFLSFLYGTGGGTKVVAYLQTSLDDGTWLDLWAFAATTASKTRARSLNPTAGEITPQDGELADNTVASGIVLGDRLRLKVIVTGTYTGSARLIGRAAVRY